MKFTIDSKVSEIHDYFEPDSEMLLSSTPTWFNEGNLAMTPRNIQACCPPWNAVNIVYGLNHLADEKEHGRGKWVSVYSDNEIACDDVKGRVKILYMPAQNPKSDIFFMLCAGGGYGAVCTFVEALPVAAKLNELGYNTFCLNYRTSNEKYKNEPLFPKPMDDLAAAMKFIENHKDVYGLDISKAVVGGFSAGGHLALSYGMENIGARHYGLPNPLALLPVYPLVTVKNHMDKPDLVNMGKVLLGKNFTLRDDEFYSASAHVDKDFPPTFIARAEDDPTISPKDGDELIEALKKANIPFKERKGATGSHGFGLGTGTSLEGYVEEAVAFFESLIR